MAAALAWGAFALLAAWRWHGRALDDFFITYRYAQNLAAGEGLVFNPGERVFGTTAPGFALLLGVLSAITRFPAHWLAAATTVVTLPLTALVAAVEAPHRRPEAIAGGCLVVGCSYVWLHQGSELPVVLCLLAASGLACERRPGLAGALAGFAVWCRPDALLGAAGLGLLAWRRQRRLPWRYAVVAVVLVILGLLAAWWWFGRPLPATLEAKRAQAAWAPALWPSGAAFWPAGLESVRRFYGGRLVGLLVAAGVLGQVPLFRHAGPGLRTVAIYGLAVSVAYPLLGVPFYTWYAVPGLVALLYGVAFGLGAALRWAGRLSSRPWRAAVTVAVLGVGATLLADPVRRAIDLAAHAPLAPRQRLYREAGRWLANHTAAWERFAAVEVGTLAYYSRRPSTDLMGLVSPEVLPRIPRHDLASAFLRHPTPVIVDSSFAPFDLGRAKFGRRYRLAAAFGGPRHWVRVHRLAPGTPLPKRRG